MFLHIVNTIDSDDFKMAVRNKLITLKRVNRQHASIQHAWPSLVGLTLLDDAVATAAE